MKFKVSPSLSDRDFSKITKIKKSLRLKGSNTLRAIKIKALVKYDRDDDFGIFEREKSSFFEKVKFLFTKFKRKRREPRVSIASLLGLLCAGITVSAVSALLLISSVFLKYGGSYTEVKIPDFVSLEASQAVTLYPDIFEYEISYERNPNKKDGSVISQMPLPNVTRRLYDRSDKIKIKLSVNTPEETITLPELTGASLRETLILLKSVGVKVNLIEEYSNNVEYGDIIYSSLPQGALIKSGDNITLKSSLGKETLYVKVPDLSGLSENQAVALLRSKNLDIGEIKYENSKLPIGTITSQSIATGTPMPEKSKISLTVSGGLYY